MTFDDQIEAAWREWLNANPDKPICTHWREAFSLGHSIATAAERERCAKIADETRLPLGGRSNSAALPYDAGNREACFHIATRIREG